MMVRMRSAASRTSGLSACRRAKATRCQVSFTARSTVAEIASTYLRRRSSARFGLRRNSVEDLMMVSILLKSWAMPPVSCWRPCREADAAKKRVHLADYNAAPVRGLVKILH
jgi:hypothetical protein